VDLIASAVASVLASFHLTTDGESCACLRAVYALLVQGLSRKERNKFAAQKYRVNQKRKRVLKEQKELKKRAEQMEMEYEEKKELTTDNAELRRDLKTSKRQLSQSRNYRSTVATQKRTAEEERDDAMEQAKQLTKELSEWMERYEEFEVEMMIDDSQKQDQQIKEDKEIKVFKNGRYDDRMRLAIFACMRANVGKDAIGPLVSNIVQLFAEKKIDRLPSPSTIAKMSTELLALTQIQTYERLTTDPTATKIMAHDGTTQLGTKFGTGR
jgi:small-conductance mechanosensitive channel